MQKNTVYDTPLLTALQNHAAGSPASFHTPGHKCSRSVLDQMGDILSLDLTELEDTDSLFEAGGVIVQAETLTAALFDAKKTLFSAGGCTLALQTMMALAVPMGGKVIAGRMIHRAAVNAMALLDIKPVWVYPSINTNGINDKTNTDSKENDTPLPGGLSVEDIAHTLRQNPDADAVYITSPDYFGTLSDIEGIAKVCRRRHIPLLVDNAHGSHLRFVDRALDPIVCGAAISAYSAHKTLPVLTGGAWLHIGDETYSANAKQTMAVFGSTSPSYPVMASLDLTRAWLDSQGASAFCTLAKKVKDINGYAQQLGFILPSGQRDPVRITLSSLGLGLTGTDLSALLAQKGIVAEYADHNHIVLIPTPFNQDSDFERLVYALKDVPRSSPIQPKAYGISRPYGTMPLRKAMFSPFERITAAQSIGRVAAETACPCPPGIPLVIPGEKIDKITANILSGYGILDVKVVK